MTFIRSLIIMTALLCVPVISMAQVRFGTTLTLSGSSAYLGKSAQEGMELARGEINESGGLMGKPLDILYEDFGEMDLRRAVLAAQKLTDIDKVTVMLPMITEDAEAMYPITSKKNIVSMAIYAGAPDLTIGRPLFYQISSSDEVQMRALADFANSHGAKNGCILAENTAYPISIEKSAIRYWQKLTGRELLTLEHNSGTVDFKPYILRARSSGCQAIFLLTSATGQGPALRQISQMHWPVLKLGFDWSEDKSIFDSAGSGIDGLVYVKYLMGTPDFIARFSKRYGREPTVPAALAYDAVRLLGTIISDVGMETEKIDRALKSIHDYRGASGTVSFDRGTRTDREAALWTVKNRAVEALQISPKANEQK